jgi:hypothetical protein
MAFISQQKLLERDFGKKKNSNLNIKQKIRCYMENGIFHRKYGILAEKVETRCKLLKLEETTQKLKSELSDTGEGYKILCSFKVIVQALYIKCDRLQHKNTNFKTFE